MAHDDYSMEPSAPRIKQADARMPLLPNIETEASVANIDEIMFVDVIDAADVGYTDLSVWLGVPGGYAHPRFIDAVDRNIAACLSRGKHVSCIATTPEAARASMARGARIILFSTDVMLLSGTLRADIAAPR